MGTVVASPMNISVSKHVKLTFPVPLIKEPLIYGMSKRYDVITNIEKASINQSEGWVILVLKGTEDDLNKALQWMADHGVSVKMMLPDF